jgi:2-amino-4-hydroxy-6-hydroxymethyldihydropteridine diphosphokinase
MNKAYLSLGSNIEPGKNLAKAIELLNEHGEVSAVSSIWASHAMEADGPDFLNACLAYLTELNADDLKDNVLKPIEAAMGRQRGGDKNAPRTIDIDLLMLNEKPLNPRQWDYFFVIIPLAELLPDLPHPVSGKRLSQVAEEMKVTVWVEKVLLR